MANISLGQLRDYWKNISDWVKGVDTVSRPKVDAQLTGSTLAQPVDIQAQLTKQLLIVTNNANNIGNTHMYFGEDGYKTSALSNVNQTNALDVSNFKEISFATVNNYDQTVSFNLFMIDFWGNAHYVIQDKQLTAGSKKYFNSNNHPDLKTPMSFVAIRITTATQPTTGNFSFSVEGQ